MDEDEAVFRPGGPRGAGQTRKSRSEHLTMLINYSAERWFAFLVSTTLNLNDGTSWYIRQVKTELAFKCQSSVIFL